MKEIYESPSAKISEFKTVDVISTSEDETTTKADQLDGDDD